MLRSLSIQFLIFFVAFQALSLLRETSMLSTDTALTSLTTTDDLSLPTVMGEQVSLLPQGKTTVLYFFAPWCQVCHASIANLQALYQKNREIDVIAIALDYKDHSEVMKFIKRHQLTFPVALGSEKIKNTFAITGYPSYYIIDASGIIESKSLGYSSELGLHIRAL